LVYNPISTSVRREVIKNLKTPLDILVNFIDNSSVNISQLTLSELLTHLANSSDNFIRAGVAQNPNTPLEILQRLAKDKDLYVRNIAYRIIRKKKLQERDKRYFEAQKQNY
jgi:hypothetical protein